MSDERLAEIQRDLAPWLTAIGGHSRLSRAACELLAEVERLRGALQRAWQLHAEAERDGDEARAGWQAAEWRISELKQAHTEAAP